MFTFSYFRKPITNLKPYRDITLEQLYEVIRGQYFKKQALQLRDLIKKEKKSKEFKANNFDYVTIAGKFSKRSNKALIKLSGLMCLDLDDIKGNIEKIKKLLAKDKALQCQMIFRSPSGNGLKVIIVDPRKGDYKESYKWVKDYVWETYAIEIDNTQDISRACFVPHDPDVWIRDHYLDDGSQIIDTFISKNPAVKKLVERLDLIVVKK